MTRRKLTILIVSGVVAALIAVGLWFIATKTSFLRRTTPASSVNANNFNQTNSAEKTYTILSSSVIGNADTTSVAGHSLNLPSAFSVDLFAEGLDAPRFFSVLAPGTLVVADKGAGELILVQADGQTGQRATKKVIDRDLRSVHSVAWFASDLYVGEEHQIVKYHDFTTTGTFSRKEVIIDDLPTGGHATRTVVIGPDKKLYVAIGSSCNLCEEKNTHRASVWQYNLDGTGGRVYASGLRNSVGLAWVGNDLWSVDNGRDLLGDNLPPEEVNLLRDGKNYGWPYCYGDKIANPEFSSRSEYCTEQTVSPTFLMQAHSAPLGLAVVPEKFSTALAGKLLISFHGSWNRTERTGYKLVWVDPAKPGTEATNFATGWLEAGGVWGRPVGLGFDESGALYVSDDQAGVIYRIRETAVQP